MHCIENFHEWLLDYGECQAVNKSHGLLKTTMQTTQNPRSTQVHTSVTQAKRKPKHQMESTLMIHKSGFAIF